MLLGFILILFLIDNTVEFQASAPTVTASTLTTDSPSDTTQTLPSVRLVAIPVYPVPAGQRIILRCYAPTVIKNVTWFWQRLQKTTWEYVGTGMELTLTEHEQSGQYRCGAKRQSLQLSLSQSYSVYIISTGATVGESLGIAAFVLSLLTLIIIIGVILWMSWQRLDLTLKTSSTADKGFPGPEMPSNKGIPQTNSDNDVYMNYTSNNQAYTDLDPSNMTGDNVYSSLS